MSKPVPLCPEHKMELQWFAGHDGVGSAHHRTDSTHRCPVDGCGFRYGGGSTDQTTEEQTMTNEKLLLCPVPGCGGTADGPPGGLVHCSRPLCALSVGGISAFVWQSLLRQSSDAKGIAEELRLALCSRCGGEGCDACEETGLHGASGTCVLDAIKLVESLADGGCERCNNTGWADDPDGGGYCFCALGDLREEWHEDVAATKIRMANEAQSRPDAPAKVRVAVDSEFDTARIQGAYVNEEHLKSDRPGCAAIGPFFIRPAYGTPQPEQSDKDSFDALAESDVTKDSIKRMDEQSDVGRVWSKVWMSTYGLDAHQAAVVRIGASEKDALGTAHPDGVQVRGPFRVHGTPAADALADTEQELEDDSRTEEPSTELCADCTACKSPDGYTCCEKDDCVARRIKPDRVCSNCASWAAGMCDKYAVSCSHDHGTHCKGWKAKLVLSSSPALRAVRTHLDRVGATADEALVCAVTNMLRYLEAEPLKGIE